MLDPLDILASAQAVDVPQELHRKVQRRLATRARHRRRWLNVAAAAAVLVWTVQSIALIGTSNSGAVSVEADPVQSELLALLDVTDNTLYDEE